ncbi:MAG TPA: SPOR domain-containing protein [Blastocatellia bacterium]|nr:SPOR domain-containing protein [Blastocatellia bacterium]
MKVTCPKCQFENQADSSRVVCARCATIIEVRMDQGFDSNGKRQTARLPFTSGGLSGGGQSLGGQRFSESDVYATRIGDDFDDVLDVPIQPQSGYQAVDETPPVPVFEDVFMPSQNQDQTSPYDFPPYDKASATPIDAYGNPSVRPRDPQDYIEPVDQEFVAWPVLPDSQEEEEATTGSGRGGLFLRIGLIIGLFGVVSFWAYYFLGDFIAKRRGRGVTASPAQTIEADNNEKPATQPPDTQPPSTDKDDQTPPGSETAVTEQPPLQPPKGSDERTLTPPAFKSSVVRPNPPTAEKPPGGTRAAEADRGNLTVQVGAFKDQGEADARAASLNAATSGEFHVVRADIPGKGLYYRVQKVSGFASREAALSYGNRLRGRNLIAEFIVTSR